MTPQSGSEPGGVPVSALENWRAELSNLEEPCPWPGPRPLSIEKDRRHAWRFVGRAAEMREFMQAISGHALVVLHGTSGAGKSSLLNVGLVTVMRKNGFAPLVCNRWQAIRGSDVEGFIAAELESQHRLPGPIVSALRRGTGLMAALDAEYGDRGVLVLDQFEELIRYQREAFTAIVDWLLEVHTTRRTRVVLSLRSEYTFELAELIRQARPFDTRYVTLTEMSEPGDISRIVLGPNRDGAQHITDSAAQTLVERWLGLPQHSRERSLLYLHAALYALFWNARADGRSTVDDRDLTALDEYAATMQRETRSTRQAQIFAAGFDMTIERKLSLCREACRAPRPDEPEASLAADVLVSATLEQIRAGVEHLSSGGYKVDQELPDLFLLTSARELGLLLWDPESEHEDEAVGRLEEVDAEALVAAFTRVSSAIGPDGSGPADMEVDLLSASSAELLEQAGVLAPPRPPRSQRSELFAQWGVDPIPWEVDPGEVTAGVLQGRPPWEPLVEQARAFAFAIEWLTETSIIRVSAPLGTAMASLVHDGFGGALKNWADRHRLSARAAIRAVTAYEGETWSWKTTNGFTGDGQPKVLVNLRWRSCEIADTSFTNVVLMNCDFRGSRFLRCTFEGATFVNCLLDNAAFDRCTIVGRAPDHDPEAPPYYGTEEPDALPEFVLALPKGLARDFATYRGSPETHPWLYSPTSGVAAVPWPERPGRAMLVEPARGGLAMYGGRLSSLMVMRCSFAQGASLTMAHIAGSSLEVVEQDVIDLLLSWCVVLDLTVSDLVDARETDGRIAVRAVESVLANAWLGSNLAGTVTIDNSRVYALTNLSDPDQLEVTIDDSLHGTVLNATTTTPARLGVDDERRDKTLDVLRDAARRMAYRSRPAQVELERRAGLLLGSPDQAAS